MIIDLVSEHASPLAAIGGVDAGGQNVHVAALAAGLAKRGHQVTVHTRRDDPDAARLAGKAARAAALERYGVARFLADWDALLGEVTR